jgi:beta-lactamase regulating signal transducer with metallopeptidase domain
MLLWMLYAIIVSLCLTGAALSAEQIARLSGGSTRGVWAIAMMAALIVPAAISSVSIRVPEIPTLISAATSRHTITLRAMTSDRLTPASLLGAGAVRLNERHDVDVLLKEAWYATSMALLLALLISGLHLAHRKRDWTIEKIANEAVYVTSDVGPAVVGLVRPRIVVPHWIKHSSPTLQNQVIAHEKSHVEAHDVQLLTGALFLVLVMPWNLPLWWQLRRLRRAVEIDCDARVLRAGHDMQSYGETLITVGQQRSSYIGAVAGMSESKSFLENRIRIMVRGPVRRWKAAAAGLGLVTVALLAVAADVAPPSVFQEAPPQSPVPLNSTDLAPYVGFYQLSPGAVLKVSLEGNQLFAQLTGQNSAKIYPSGHDHFFYKIVDAQISFQNVDGTIAGLILHQDGADMPAPRIDADAAKKIEDALRARLQRDAPLPGSQAAARRLIDSIVAGSPIYNEMSPALADATRQQQKQLQTMVSELGPVVSTQFVGVANNGWDVYAIKHEHGGSHLRITLDSNGMITGAWLSPGL